MTIQTPIDADNAAPRVEAIRRRHRTLHQRVAEVQKRPHADPTILRRLKREKLRLKDELHHYEGLLRTVSRGPATS